MWSLKLLPSGLNLILYPGYNDLSKGVDKHLYARVTSDASLINKAKKTYIDEWKAVFPSTKQSWTPKHLLIATWKNYNQDKWDAKVSFLYLHYLWNSH